jgi:hypothetical protein
LSRSIICISFVWEVRRDAPGSWIAKACCVAPRNPPRPERVADLDAVVAHHHGCTQGERDHGSTHRDGDCRLDDPAPGVGGLAGADEPEREDQDPEPNTPDQLASAPQHGTICVLVSR